MSAVSTLNKMCYVLDKSNSIRQDFSPLDSIKKYKGLLYKIQNAELKTVGYLFGTFHYPLVTFQKNLHEKIDHYLKKSQVLFVEKNALDLQKAAEFNPKIDLVEAEKWIHSERISPKALDSFLILRAEYLEIPIDELESGDSYLNADHSIASERDLYFKRARTRINGLIYLAQFHLQKVQNDSDRELYKGFSCLHRAFKDMQQTYHGVTDRKNESQELSENISRLILIYREQLNNFPPENITEDLNQEVSDFCAFLFATLKDHYESEVNQFLAWAKSDEVIFSKVNNNKKTFKELEVKKLFERDTAMLNRITETLSKASKTRRSFFAVGASHLVDENYWNLKDRLQEAGWRVITAYNDE